MSTNSSYTRAQFTTKIGAIAAAVASGAGLGNIRVGKILKGSSKRRPYSLKDASLVKM